MKDNFLMTEMDEETEQDREERLIHLRALLAAVIRQAVDDYRGIGKARKESEIWEDHKRTAVAFLRGLDCAGFMSYLGINRIKALKAIGLEPENAEPATEDVSGVPAV